MIKTADSPGPRSRSDRLRGWLLRIAWIVILAFPVLAQEIDQRAITGPQALERIGRETVTNVSNIDKYSVAHTDCNREYLQRELQIQSLESARHD